MNEQLILCNRLKEARASQHLSQAQLAKLVGVSRNTISSIETGQFNPTAKLALLLCIALDWTGNLKTCSTLRKRPKKRGATSDKKNNCLATSPSSCFFCYASRSSGCAWKNARVWSALRMTSAVSASKLGNFRSGRR